MTWWHAAATGTFYLVGLAEPWSDRLGPLLPSVCAGLSAMLLLLIADAAIGHLAGVVTAFLLLLMPAFVPPHAESLLGPPLLAIVLLQLAVMLHAPRFSLAYGTVAAVAAVSVSSAALGVPVAAVLWALLKGGRDGTTTGSPRRGVLALLPLALVVGLAYLTGAEWTPEEPQVAPGWMGRGLRLGVSIVGDQLAPGIAQPVLRGAVIALMLLLLGWLVFEAWRRVARGAAQGSVLRRLYPAVGILGVCYAGGLVQRLMWSGGGAVPDASAMLPLLSLALVLVTVSVAALWTRWPRALRGATALVMVLWVAGAILTGE